MFFKRGQKPLKSERSQRSRRKQSPVLRVEAQEGRLAPATHTWVGGASNLWSNAANWAEAAAPT